MRAGLADRDAVRVRTGAAATVRLGAYPGEMFAGRVTSVSAAASQGTGTWAVEVTLDPTSRSLGSGLVGTVEIAPAGASAMRLVPVQALAEADGDSATVFTLDDDGRTARRRSVRVAFVRDGRAALAAGLDGATHVVTDGVAYLRDGSLVKAAAATTETASTASAAKGAGRTP